MTQRWSTCVTVSIAGTQLEKVFVLKAFGLAQDAMDNTKRGLDASLVENPIVI